MQGGCRKGSACICGLSVLQLLVKPTSSGSAPAASAATHCTSCRQASAEADTGSTVRTESPGDASPAAPRPAPPDRHSCAAMMVQVQSRGCRRDTASSTSHSTASNTRPRASQLSRRGSAAGSHTSAEAAAPTLCQGLLNGVGQLCRGGQRVRSRWLSSVAVSAMRAGLLLAASTRQAASCCVGVSSAPLAPAPQRPSERHRLQTVLLAPGAQQSNGQCWE